MKKYILIIAACTSYAFSYAQDNKKEPTIGVHLILNDFKTANELRTLGLSDVLNGKQWSNTQRMVAGLGFSYIKGLTNHLDFAANLSGSYVNYPVPNRVSDGQQSLLLEAVATANLKMFPDNYLVVPFLTAGVGASKYRGYYGAIMPIGVGLQIRILEGTSLLVNSQYRIPVTTTTTAYHFFHSFGVGVGLGKRATPAPAAEVNLETGN